ncbi:DUF6402 family protein [Helicobacter saguini]|uniref:Uncharacterized protein n=1 Tax=Helicobacter saguini TaxID=1548018 RepID=A0A6L7DGG1_9HELI|nr:DUF6402 family protein [Helicobacter saguini]MWV69498.1 hypothetical protein [Helicobacter saguini]
MQTYNIEPLKLSFTPYPKDVESNDAKTLRQRAELFSYHKNNQVNNINETKRPIRFYTTLNWDKFYMQFPLIKRLSDFDKQKIYSDNFLTHIRNMLINNKNIITFIKRLSQGEYRFNFAIDIRENRSNKNVESYIIAKENDKLPQGYKFILQCKPYEIDNLNCQLHGIDDDEFFMQTLRNLGTNIAGQFSVDISATLFIKQARRSIPVVGQGILAYEAYNVSKEINQQFYNDTMQDLSLYACSGKFSIYYAPTQISIKKEIKNNKEKVVFRIDKMVAYVYDSFDFLDQPHIFNDNGEIIKLGQPVGAWDFDNKCFSISGSISQIVTYMPKKFKKYIIGHAIPDVSSADILESKKTNQYYIYNQDYQDYQKFTPYGLDFKLYSDDFIAKLHFDEFKYSTLYDTIG